MSARHHCRLQDFDSPTLKNKKHWNSFTQHGFFLPPRDVIAELADEVLF